jgi:hypothetical protein
VVPFSVGFLEAACLLTSILSSLHSFLQQNHLLVIHQVCPNTPPAKRLMQNYGMKKLEGIFFLVSFH